MRYGYISQGIYMLDFSWAYSWAMRVVMGGNMGSDSQTIILTKVLVTLDTVILTL